MYEAMIPMRYMKKKKDAFAFKGRPTFFNRLMTFLKLPMYTLLFSAKLT